MTLAGRATPAVTFGEGRRPESRTQVQVAEFDGPLGLLLSLIEARQLDVLTVPLGALADAYLDALGRLEADRLGNVSSFVAIASQLILIKSRAMLPRRTDPTDPTGDWPTTASTPRPSSAPASSSTARTATPACGWPRARSGGSGSSDASRVRHAPRARPARDRSTRPRSTRTRLVRALDRLAAIAPPPEPPPEIDGPDRSPSPSAPRSSGRRCATRRPFVLQDLLDGRPRPGRDRDHVPGDARADEAARDRRRAGRAVGPDRRPRSTTAEERAAAGVDARAADAPIDETLESFA